MWAGMKRLKTTLFVFQAPRVGQLSYIPNPHGAQSSEAVGEGARRRLYPADPHDYDIHDPREQAWSGDRDAAGVQQVEAGSLAGPITSMMEGVLSHQRNLLGEMNNKLDEMAALTRLAQPFTSWYHGRGASGYDLTPGGPIVENWT
jgi:hypothetical protein